jgi:predicted esterase
MQMTFKHPAIAVFLLGLLSSGAIYAKSPVDDLKDYLAQPRDQRKELASQPFATQAISKDEAEQAKQLLWDDHVKMIKETRQKEWDDNAITIGEHTLKLKTKHVGEKPKDGWNLFISMHGGGNAPAEVNDQQWENQIQLYDPPNSLYIAPRAPTDTWNLWHEDHIDGLFTRLIEDAIVLDGVDPNHVYIMGYSAGGDGVYQLAPRMADSLAAASMMAGHPNDASPLGLRNLPFTIHVGALDDGYHRNDVAKQWGEKLDKLQKDDPQGYIHEVKLHEGRAHWMNREDAVAVDWMEKYTRNPLPDKVVWMQGNKPHDRFYWLSVPEKDAKKGQLIIASRDGQNITVEKTDGVTTFNLMLNDAMLDMDKPLTIHIGDKTVNAPVTRTIGVINETLSERGDPDLVFSAMVAVKVGE